MKHIKKLKAGAVLSDGKIIYIVYRNNGKNYDYSLPKGHQEKGETFEETAIRETFEETGIQGEIIGAIKTINYAYKEDGNIFDCEVHFYAMKVIKLGEKTFIDDVNKVLSFPIEEIQDHLTYETDKEVVKEWRNKFFKH